MKARPEDQRELLKLQEKDNHLAQLRKTLNALPERKDLEEVTATLREFSQSLIAAQGELEDSQRELAKIEDDVRVVEERIAKDQERESASTSVKDVQALEAELQSLAQRKGILEDAELEVMQIVEDKQAAVDAVVSEKNDAEQKRQELSEKITLKENEIEAEIAQTIAERAEIVSTLPGDLIELYERQRERYGVGAALLTRRISGGSGVELTSTDLDKIRAAAEDDVVLCPDSSCILIRTEESGL